MGRKSTGAETTAGVRRIELKQLLRDKFIQKGRKIRSTLSWSRGEDKAGRITIETAYTDQEQYIRLIYTVTSYNGNSSDQDYKIYLEQRPSNLGRGEVLYFLCPDTMSYCRVLYQAYGSHIFMSRQAYTNRIYYPLQVSSKREIYNDRYWELDKLLEKLRQERETDTYKGVKTRRRKRIERLEAKQERADWLRFRPIAFPKRLRNFVPH